uniref:3-isopropylmalate dehydratase small subunit n=1 Tax=Thermofilum pendens TaxID=2269 RepID=A0A7C1T2L6_THEPE
MIVRGRCWRLGDNVSTDHIISGKYKFEAIDDLSKMAVHVLEEVVPGFYKLVSSGDVIVGGRNFGKGSSREHAPRLLKLVGVGAVVAKSFAHTFFRNAINIGLPVVVARTIPDISETGDVMEVDAASGVVRNLTKGVEERVAPYPREILEIVASGGIVEYIKRYGGLPWRGGTR